MELPDDLAPWVQAKADALFYGDTKQAVLWILAEAREAERWRHTSRYGTEPADEPGAWADLGSEPRRTNRRG